MAVKGIIFDLDDTLFDATNTSVKHGVEAVTKAMAKILGVNYKKLLAKRKELMKKNPSITKTNIMLCHELGIHGEKAAKACEAGRKMYYTNAIVKNIKLFPGAMQMIRRLRKKYKVGLVTFGDTAQQNKKIDILKLRNEFDFIGINEYKTLGLTKEECFQDFIKRFNLKPDEVFVVGDKPGDEIRIANRLRITTIRVLKGRYAAIKPADDYELADYSVKNVAETEKIINKISGIK